MWIIYIHCRTNFQVMITSYVEDENKVIDALAKTTKDFCDTIDPNFTYWIDSTYKYVKKISITEKTNCNWSWAMLFTSTKQPFTYVVTINATESKWV